MNFLYVFGAVTLVNGHSWPDNIGGGSYRGAQGANDLIKERYFCPLASVDACQPGHGIVLTASSQRACRTDFPTPVWGNGVAGQQMYVHWAGNGHTSTAQSGGTCVKIAIAPYAIDPEMSSFTTLANCLPYSHGSDITDGYVTLPANLPTGKYTVFWLWDFAPFWFTGCGDINVVGASTATTTPRASTATTARPASSTPLATTARPASTTPLATTTRAAAATTTTRAPSTAGTTKPATTGANADCRDALLPNSNCQSLFGPSSYCVSWQLDSCGKARCAGAPPVVGCTGATSTVSGGR